MERIPVSGPWITQKEIDYVTDAVTHAWYAQANVYHERFERAFADYVGRRFAMALPSCTSAIHLALLTLGVGPGDEVIVPDATWIASAAPITYVGATPIFADIDPLGWCLDPAAFEAAITPRTKAAIVVDLYGNMPDMDALKAVADRHGVALIEDAAEAIGAEWHGGKAGSFGEASVFSFHGSKTLTTGEGGMLLTDREDLYQQAAFLRDHGRKPGDRMFYNAEVAYKYKMSSMQAALGLAQLERVEELVARKREIFDWYRQGLSGVPGVTLNQERPGSKSTYWMVTVMLDPALGLRKEDLMAQLEARGIDARPFFHPLSTLPAYRQAASTAGAAERNPVSHRLSPWGVNLPSGFDLTPEKVKSVCDTLIAILTAARAATP